MTLLGDLHSFGRSVYSADPMWASWASLVDLISTGFNSSFMEGKGTGQQIFYNILGWFFGFGVVQVVFFSSQLGFQFRFSNSWRL